MGLVEPEKESALLRYGYRDCGVLAFALSQHLTWLGFMAWWNDLGIDILTGSPLPTPSPPQLL